MGFFFCLFNLLGLGYFFTHGLKKLQCSANHSSPISVIIPFRNEKERIIPLLHALKQYSWEKVEFIFVDDHSDDNTAEIINEALKEGKISYRIVDSIKPGKKWAQYTGVNASSSEIILCTDADAVVTPQWAKAMLHELRNKHFVFGNVVLLFQEKEGSWKNMQQYEQSMFTTLAYVSYLMKAPFLCSGASMGFYKKDYLQLFEAIHPEIPSGDDVFLLNAMYKQWGIGGIEAIFSPETKVTVQGVPSFSEYIMQKRRWVSKWNHFDKRIRTTAFFWLINYLILYFLAGQLFFIHGQYLWIGLLVMGLKAIFDILFLYLAGLKGGGNMNIFKVALWYFLYGPVLLAGMLLNKKQSVIWKHRTIQ